MNIIFHFTVSEKQYCVLKKGIDFDKSRYICKIVCITKDNFKYK